MCGTGRCEKNAGDWKVGRVSRSHDGHAKVAQDVVGGIVGEEVGQYLPRMGERVLLQEVVFTPIPRHLQLRSEPVAAAVRLGAAHRLTDAMEIPFEILR